MEILTTQVGMIATNCYLVFDEHKKGVVIDPGDQGQTILALAQKHGIQIQAILITHGHFDHIGAVKSLKDALGVPVYVHTLDADRLTGENNANNRFGVHVQPVTPDVLFGDGDRLDFGGLSFVVVHTPGHTPGSCCFLISDTMFSGDTLFYGDTGRTDLEGGDFNQMVKSIAKLKNLQGDFAVYPGHDQSTTLNHERLHNQLMSKL